MGAKEKTAKGVLTKHGLSSISVPHFPLAPWTRALRGRVGVLGDL